MVAYQNAIFYLRPTCRCLKNCGHFSYYLIIVGRVFCNSCAEVPTWKIDNLNVVICRSINLKELVSSVNFVRLTLQCNHVSILSQNLFKFAIRTWSR